MLILSALCIQNTRLLISESYLAYGVDANVTDATKMMTANGRNSIDAILDDIAKVTLNNTSLVQRHRNGTCVLVDFSSGQELVWSNELLLDRGWRWSEVGDRNIRTDRRRRGFSFIVDLSKGVSAEEEGRSNAGEEECETHRSWITGLSTVKEIEL